ncbi:MAG: S-adenosylmethionine decarboxylase [Microgenomates group bacterium Gr01-1014_5]|nr:MAG: S-adenosylmethionine decarboxylase [Microgenomates group bacterium Gr01-1014_5]
MSGQSSPTIHHYVALVKLQSLDNSPVFIRKAAREIIKSLALTVVKKTSHFFYPQGVTLAYILSESHLLIHTWPEFKTIHIDLVICSYRGKDEFELAVNSAFSKYNIESIRIKEVSFDESQSS